MKRIDFNKKEFTANKVKYEFTEALSIARFPEFEKLQHHVGFGLDFQETFDRIKNAYELLNAVKFADAAVVMSNLIEGIKEKIEKREHPVLMFCALFINRKGEDLGRYDEDDMKRKINDWREEGIEIKDFFHFAASIIEGFIPVLNEISQSTSKLMEAAEKNITEKESLK